MTGTRVGSLIFLSGLTVLFHSAAAQQPNKDALAQFAGTWQAQCQDGRTFIVLALQPQRDQLDGTVSIGNMHGDDEGACMLVTAPPTPEHAQKITNAVANRNMLSFNGSKRPDGSSTRFELTQTAPDKAELKLLDTPVEKHPWLLVKSQKTE
jgi:hypothetical protein